MRAAGLKVCWTRTISTRPGVASYYVEDAQVVGILVRAHPRRYRPLRAWERLFKPTRPNFAAIIRKNLCDPLRAEYALTSTRYFKVFREAREGPWERAAKELVIDLPARTDA